MLALWSSTVISSWNMREIGPGVEPCLAGFENKPAVGAGERGRPHIPHHRPHPHSQSTSGPPIRTYTHGQKDTLTHVKNWLSGSRIEITRSHLGNEEPYA